MRMRQAKWLSGILRTMPRCWTLWILARIHRHCEPHCWTGKRCVSQPVAVLLCLFRRPRSDCRCSKSYLKASRTRNCLHPTRITVRHTITIRQHVIERIDERFTLVGRLFAQIADDVIADTVGYVCAHVGFVLALIVASSALKREATVVERLSCDLKCTMEFI